MLAQPECGPGLYDGRIRLFCKPVQEIPHDNYYDFIVSGLPLTAFDLGLVKDVFATFRRCLKPDGVLSYFEYVGMRRTSRALSVGHRALRVRSVSSFLTRRIRRHQFDRRTVLRNLPPAHARHLRFSDDTPTT